MSSQFALLAQRRFAPFFGAQFLGAFNDNLFKTALVTVITYDALAWTTLPVGLLNNLIAGLFILPFLVMSATAGQIADKFEKSRLVRMIKLLEVAIMALAAIGWLTHTLWLLVLAVVAMGLQSALFGPVKHAYLPQHLQPAELIGGNGMVQMGTFVGILTGQISGALLVTTQTLGMTPIITSTLLVAVLGWQCSRSMPVTPPADPGLQISPNPLREMVHNLRMAAGNRPVFIAMLANSWFWFFGAMLLAQFPVFARDTLHGEPGVFVVLLTGFSLGIGVGSLLCERLSGGRLDIGLVPAGALALTVFGIDLYFASRAYAVSPGSSLMSVGSFMQSAAGLRIIADCTVLGAAGGIYVVPLFAQIQLYAERARLSRTVGGMNILNALFMVVAAFVAMLLLQAGLTVPQIFLFAALLNLLVLSLLCWLHPSYLHALINRLRGRAGRRLPDH